MENEPIIGQVYDVDPDCSFAENLKQYNSLTGWRCQSLHPAEGAGGTSIFAIGRPIYLMVKDDAADEKAFANWWYMDRTFLLDPDPRPPVYFDLKETLNATRV